MMEMKEDVKEKDAKIKELEERLAGNVTGEEAGVTIKKEVGAEEQEVVRLRKENCNLNKELRGLKVGNPISMHQFIFRKSICLILLNYALLLNSVSGEVHLEEDVG